jgi:2'-hydroxyisoflavone reductase
VVAEAQCGGDVVAPGPPSLTVQCVDVRDLAGWLLDAAQRGLVGTFNALSRPGHATMATLLEGCRQVTGSGARLRWCGPEAVLAAGVRPWSQLPIWVPPSHPLRPLHETNTDRAAAAGLRCRPIEQTVVDTWQWMRTTDDLEVTRWADPNLGLSPTAETMLIRAMDGSTPA